MDVIVYKDDYSLKVVIPTGEVSINDVIKSVVPKECDYIIIDYSKLPESREFREAWGVVDNDIVIDIDKARDVKRNKIRIDRSKLLYDLDVEVMKNISNPSILADIEIRKQKLRDAPSSHLFLDATTVDDLSKITIEDFLNG